MRPTRALPALLATGLSFAACSAPAGNADNGVGESPNPPPRRQPAAPPADPLLPTDVEAQRLLTAMRQMVEDGKLAGGTVAVQPFLLNYTRKAMDRTADPTPALHVPRGGEDIGFRVAEWLRDHLPEVQVYDPSGFANALVQKGVPQGQYALDGVTGVRQGGHHIGVDVVVWGTVTWDFDGRKGAEWLRFGLDAIDVRTGSGIGGRVLWEAFSNEADPYGSMRNIWQSLEEKQAGWQVVSKLPVVEAVPELDDPPETFEQALERARQELAARIQTTLQALRERRSRDSLGSAGSSSAGGSSGRGGNLAWLAPVNLRGLTDVLRSIDDGEFELGIAREDVAELGDDAGPWTFGGNEYATVKALEEALRAARASVAGTASAQVSAEFTADMEKRLGALSTPVRLWIDGLESGGDEISLDEADGFATRVRMADLAQDPDRYREWLSTKSAMMSLLRKSGVGHAVIVYIDADASEGADYYRFGARIVDLEDPRYLAETYTTFAKIVGTQYLTPKLEGQ